MKSGVIFSAFISSSLLTSDSSDFNSLGALIRSERFLMSEIFASYKNTIIANIFEKDPYPKYITISAQISLFSIIGNKLFLVGLLILLQFDIMKIKT